MENNTSNIVEEQVGAMTKKQWIAPTFEEIELEGGVGFAGVDAGIYS